MLLVSVKFKCLMGMGKGAECIYDLEIFIFCEENSYIFRVTSLIGSECDGKVKLQVETAT